MYVITVASPDRVDAQRSQPVRLHQMQVWGKGKPQICHNGVRQTTTVPECFNLHVHTTRASDYGQHWRCVDCVENSLILIEYTICLAGLSVA